MSSIDVEALMLPVPGDAECGPALDYDESFQRMERAAESKPEQQIGKTVVPAQDPDWKALHTLATGVLGRSKDLRAAVFLARAALHTEGLDGFAAGLTLVRRLLETYWDHVHPQLDPEEGNDPTARMNVLDSLTSIDATLRALRETPLVSSRAMGRFGLRDFEIAAGELPLPAGHQGEPPTPDRIAAAFADATTDEISATAEAVGTALAEVQGIDRFLASTLPAGSQADLEPLLRCLRAMRKPLLDALAHRGLTADTEGAAQAEGTAAQPAAAAAVPGAIASWDDVERSLDRLCEFYRTAQPASPVPLLLQRARGMVRMDFMELLAELAPAGISEAEKVLLPSKKA